MLKRSEEPPENGNDDERGLGELVTQLIDEGKAYARAEFDLAKATAKAKAETLKVPAILFGIAFISVLAAVTALSIGIFAALANFVGPLASGLITFLLFAAIAGALGWYGAKRLREDL